MNQREKNLQHAMTSFAFFGGMLVSPNNRPRENSRVVSHPSNFVPIEIKRPR